MSILSSLLSAVAAGKITRNQKQYSGEAKGKQSQPKQKQPPQPKPKQKPDDSKKAKQLPDCEVPYFDSHCHLDWIVLKANSDELKKKKDAATTYTWNSFASQHLRGAFDGALTVCCDRDRYDSTLELIQSDDPWTSKLYGAFGLHPHNAKEYDGKFEEKLLTAMKLKKTVAWGECGLDYHYMHSPVPVQKKIFIRQIQMAVKVKKPLVVHSREAEEDTLAIMKDHVPKDWKVHLHCFTDSTSFAKQMLEAFPNLMIGFTGCITFPNAHQTRETVAAVPLDRLLLETDGPYMAPEPFRGQVAHPGHIPYVAARVGLIKGVSQKEVLDQVRKNITKLYGIQFS